MPGGVVGRLRSRGWRDGDERGEESTTEEVDGDPPGEDEGDIYARSSGLVKDICGGGIRNTSVRDWQHINICKFNGFPRITRP